MKRIPHDRYFRRAKIGPYTATERAGFFAVHGKSPDRPFQRHTARIVSALREGVVPWHQPWTAALGWPRNLISGKPYRGVNVWLLSHQHEGAPFWLTYRQAVQIGGHVKTGATGQTVMFWKFMARTGGEQDGQEGGEEDRKGQGAYAMAHASVTCRPVGVALVERPADSLRTPPPC